MGKRGKTAIPLAPETEPATRTRPVRLATANPTYDEHLEPPRSRFKNVIFNTGSPGKPWRGRLVTKGKREVKCFWLEEQAARWVDEMCKNTARPHVNAD